MKRAFNYKEILRVEKEIEILKEQKYEASKSELLEINKAILELETEIEFLQIEEIKLRKQILDKGIEAFKANHDRVRDNNLLVMQSYSKQVGILLDGFKLSVDKLAKNHLDQLESYHIGYNDLERDVFLENGVNIDHYNYDNVNELMKIKTHAFNLLNLT